MNDSHRRRSAPIIRFVHQSRWTAASPCMPSTPSNSSACATASAWPGPRTTGATPGSRPPGCARIRTCSVQCRSATPPSSSCASGRAWPRSCSGSCLRLANRIRQQLWRPYPQLLALSDDLTAEWILELWSLAPTPAEAVRLSEATLAPLLRRHRIRRLDAAGVLGVLRRPAIAVAAGVTEAAVLHPRSLLARLRLANAEFCQAERKVDELCAALSRHAAA